MARLFSTRSNDLVFFPSFDPFFSLGCLGAGDSLKLSGFLERVGRLSILVFFSLKTRFVNMVF